MDKPRFLFAGVEISPSHLPCPFLLCSGNCGPDGSTSPDVQRFCGGESSILHISKGAGYKGSLILPALDVKFMVDGYTACKVFLLVLFCTTTVFELHM
jgi:hypothetical protein